MPHTLPPVRSAELFLDVPPMGKRILAVGCGASDVGAELLAAGAAEVVGLDACADGLSRVKLTAVYRINPDAAPRLPYPPAYFDVILVEDLSRLLVPGPTLAHLRPWLADDGHLVCAVHNATRDEALASLVLLGAPPPGTGTRPLEPEHAREAIRGAGFALREPASTVRTIPSAAGELLAQAAAALGADPVGVRERLATARTVLVAGAAPLGLARPSTLDAWRGARPVRVLVVPDLSRPGDVVTDLDELGACLAGTANATVSVVVPREVLARQQRELQRFLTDRTLDLRLVPAPEGDDGWLRLVAGAGTVLDLGGDAALWARARWVGVPIERFRGVARPTANPPVPSTTSAASAIERPALDRPTVPVAFGEGFHQPEGSRRWLARSASFRVRAPSAPATLSFDLSCVEAERYSPFPFDVTVSAGAEGMYVLTFDAPRQSRSVSIQLEPGTGATTVAIESQASFSPASTGRSGDFRDLAVQFSDLKLNGQPLEARPMPGTARAGVPDAAEPRYELAGLASQEGYPRALAQYCLNPTVLVEINSRCNFHCPYCRSARSTRQKSFMRRELFDHILKQLKGLTTQDLRLHVDGEPTLHPEFLEMALSANRAGHRLAVATNASNLRPEFLDIEMALVVNVSASPEELAQRTPMRYARYLSGVKQYVRLWSERPNKQQLVLKIYATAAEQAQRSLLEPKHRFARAFVEEVGIGGGGWTETARTLEYTFAKPGGERLTFTVQQMAEGGLYPNLSGVREPACHLPVGRGFCDAPWKTLAILSDGAVSYCCVDITGETAFTDPQEIWQRSLKDIWLDHPALRRDREDLLSGRVTRPICRRCLGAFRNREAYLFTEDFPYPPPSSHAQASIHGGAK